MAFNFSAMQFDQGRASRNNNWEYPRFAPPRPRSLRLNAKPVCDNNGHLLPTARRDGNSFGQYRGTYELPLRITRSFVSRYDACLTGRYKFRSFPRDVCPCYHKRYPCDKRTTLGKRGDPYWDKPSCAPKCKHIQEVLSVHKKSLVNRRCPKCQLAKEESDKYMLKPQMLKSNYKNRKIRARPVTAFAANRAKKIAILSAVDKKSKPKSKENKQ